ncbi:protein GRIP-like [Musa acuminata AAA Group]|uniref:protein GRIP-like n=1 Tax=Musa acuminata AAA Group TaxID=214697 RepID=UPI0031DD6963
MAPVPMDKKASPVAAVPPPSPDGESLGKVESLKTLNELLFMETEELRQKIRDLRSHLDHLSLDHSLSSDLENDITRLVLASRLAEFAEEMTAAEERTTPVEADLVMAGLHLESADADKDAIEKTLDAAISDKVAVLEDTGDKNHHAELQVAVLLEEMESLEVALKQNLSSIGTLEVEKATMGEKIKYMEEVLRTTDDQLLSIAREKGEIEKDLELAIMERNACRRDLHAMSMVLEKTKEEFAGYQAANNALDQGIVKLERQFEEEHATVIKDVNRWMGKVGGTERRKEELEQQISILQTKITDLQGKVSKSEAIRQEKIALEEKLGSVEEALKSANERFDLVAAEKDGLKKALEQATLERESTQRKLTDEANKCKAMIAQVTEELKMKLGLKAVDESKAKQEGEIATLQGQVADLSSTLSALVDSSGDITGRKAQRQAEKEAVLRDLDLEKAKVRRLRLQLEKLKKGRDDAANVLRKMVVVIEGLIAENRIIETSELITGLVTAGNEDGVGRGIDIEQDADESMEHMGGELEAMKTALKSKLAKVEGMDQALNLLGGAVEGKKNGGEWRWLCPTAATLLAAISLAYAAKH